MKKIGLYLFTLLASLNVYAEDVSIDVTSKTLEIERINGTALFKGNVKALYKDATLTSDNLKIVYDEKSGTKNKIEKIIATDNVVVIQGSDKITSDKAEYFINLDEIIFEGNVVLNRNGNLLEGEHLTMNTKTKKALMKSTGVNRVKAFYFNKTVNSTK